MSRRIDKGKAKIQLSDSEFEPEPIEIEDSSDSGPPKSDPSSRSRGESTALVAKSPSPSPNTSHDEVGLQTSQGRTKATAAKLATSSPSSKGQSRTANHLFDDSIVYANDREDLLEGVTNEGARKILRLPIRSGRMDCPAKLCDKHYTSERAFLRHLTQKHCGEVADAALFVQQHHKASLTRLFSMLSQKESTQYKTSKNLHDANLNLSAEQAARSQLIIGGATIAALHCLCDEVAGGKSERWDKDPMLQFWGNLEHKLRERRVFESAMSGTAPVLIPPRERSPNTTSEQSGQRKRPAPGGEERYAEAGPSMPRKRLSK